MRFQIHVYDAFNRDTSWLTQEAIEDIAGSYLRSLQSGMNCVARWAGNDDGRIKLAYELVVDNPDLRILQDELLEEFGEEHFIGKAKSKEWCIRELESRIANEVDNKTVAALMKELRELRGWVIKPSEATPANLQVNIGTQGVRQIDWDATDPAEAERIAMSVFGSAG